MNTNQLLRTTMGNSGETIRVAFKKTVNVKQFESEVVEAETSLTTPYSINGGERVIVSAMLEGQLEYQIYYGLACRGCVTNTELATRQSLIEQEISTLINNSVAAGITSRERLCSILGTNDLGV